MCMYVCVTCVCEKNKINVSVSSQDITNRIDIKDQLLFAARCIKRVMGDGRALRMFEAIISACVEDYSKIYFSPYLVHLILCSVVIMLFSVFEEN